MTVPADKVLVLGTATSRGIAPLFDPCRPAVLLGGVITIRMYVSDLLYRFGTVTGQRDPG
jgi:hypothetical protein